MKKEEEERGGGDGMVAMTSSVMGRTVSSSSDVVRVLVFCYPQRPLEQIGAVLQRELERNGEDYDVSTSVLRYDDSTTVRMAAMKEFLSDHGDVEDADADKERRRTSTTATSTTTTASTSSRTVRILLSTDLAARGLDIDDISLVINYDLPTDTDTYVHRGGRAGRFGRKGVVMSLITAKEEFVLVRLGNKLGCDLKCVARQREGKKVTKGGSGG